MNRLRENIVYNGFCRNLGSDPTGDQSEAFRKAASFITGDSDDTILVIKGYAGTGKTSLIGAMVKTLDNMRVRSVLLAPTGRAAKVLGTICGRRAFTIHKKIFRQKSSKDGMGSFVLDRNRHTGTYFIVDEASMISNESSGSSMFGSGRLLDDLLEYVYSGKGCRLVLVGDSAQLPPVGLAVSPALDMAVLKESGFGLLSSELKQVVRQEERSGILMNATLVRIQISEGSLARPSMKCEGYSDMVRLSGGDLIDELAASYGSCGLEGTIVVVNSNKQANRYNQGIRNRIFFREEDICPGDIVMVVKNNYALVEEDEEGPGFIANGDIAEVKRIKRIEERYGFRFAEMNLWFPDYGYELDCKVMLDVLYLDTPALPAEKSRELFRAVLADYLHLRSRKEQYQAVRDDPWFNALQVKFAYAVTCHKAQGGQWDRVFIDQGMFNRSEVTVDYLRWFYTALTRSSGKVYLVNFPDDFFNGE
jgi:exodeoxyribonuclease-5